MDEYVKGSGKTKPFCADPKCAHAVKSEKSSGRFFITIGHPGFNSPANNRDGYESEPKARAALARYAGK